jgi:hypothetical protein
MNTRTALIAGLLAGALAIPAWSDTLMLRDGGSLKGVLTGADGRTITFQDGAGRTYRYSVDEVQAVEFGDAQYNSNDNQPQNAPPDNSDYGPPPNSGPNNSRYDQAVMERVVIPPGTDVAVRTNERIDSKEVVQGQTFSAQTEEDIRGADGSVAIPRGSDVELITRPVQNNGDITLDVLSITVQGRRYRVSTADEQLDNSRDSVGANKRTGQFVGGGAIFGAIIGAVAGGGKGAAIGAVSGAGAGAAAQIITRGREIHVPAESVIRFQLDKPLRLHLWS